MAPRLQLENLTLLLHPALLAQRSVRSSSGHSSELCNRCCRFRHNLRVSSRRTSWVLLAYRLPRDPSTPRRALRRKLRRLGAVQVLDGLAALPLDARNREQLEWLAAAVVESGGGGSSSGGRLAPAPHGRERARRKAN